MSYTDFNPEAMDAAAKEAKYELNQLNLVAIAEVAQWFKKWYMQAGHKRLGRILIQEAKAPVVR